MQLNRLLRISATAGLAATLTLGATIASANALDVEVENLSDGWYSIADGSAVAVDQSLALNLTESKEIPEGEVTPYLIDFVQHQQCYTFNFVDIEFASYDWWWDGAKAVKRLKCGTHNADTNNGWGYRHIEARHQSHWQAKLVQIQALGHEQGTAWDDVMSWGAAAAIHYPDFTRHMPTQNKICTVGTLAYVLNGSVIQTFNVAVSFATDSDRLITAYPNSGSTC